MPTRQCPRCAIPGRHLAASSENAMVDYFRCERCGHVWAVDKQTGSRTDVTYIPESPDRVAR